MRKYLGSVVPPTDNFFATLNSAVFSDGSFVYVPPGVRCPMELSTYFRINERNTGQFERTLIIADKGAYVSYLEGCTAPKRDENQLHAAVVELIALDDAEIKYSTVQNWYPGDAEGKGGSLQLRHQARRLPRHQLEDLLDAGRDRLGDHLEISVLHPARRQFARRILFDRDFERPSAGRFRHQDDPSRQEHDEPGHLEGHRRGRTRRTPIAARSRPIARRPARAISPTATRSLIGNDCGAHTVPYIELRNPSTQFEHEATTSKISEDQLFYCMQRGLSAEEATALIVNGFVRDVLQQLPMEFAVEAQKLIAVSLEGSVG